MPRMAQSHTRLDAFENCPLSFKAKYLDKVPEVKGAPVLVGGFFADWSKRYIDHLVETRQPSDHDAGRRILEEAWRGRGEHKEFRMMPETLRFDVRGLVDSFLESHVFDPATVMGTELDVALREDWTPTGWFDKDVFFRAKLDFAALPPTDDGKVVAITDYKTGYAAWSEEETKNSSQLSRYVVAMASMIPDAARFTVTLDFVRSGIVRGPYEMEPEVAEEERASILAISDRVEAALRAGKWEATPGAGCAYCPIFDACPKKKEAAPLRALQTEEDATLAIQRLIMVDKEAKDLKAKLKDWTSEKGVLVANGMQFGPSRTDHTSYPSDFLSAWAAKYGIDPWAILKNDNEAIKKALKKVEADKREKAEAELETKASLKSFTEFRLKKFAGEDA